MHLKKLELVGFKSFNEKTQFLFNEGITCIVGPNGCGKTNLLDALRWVLGEQKTSLLRGSKMEEVIFAGTRALKPLGMSEVSLHIDNRTGTLPTQYREILVTRRLFRSGESEYLINKVPCRLKDITDLFAGTGVGAHAYAIIQQDMVDAILSDKTDERRFLFEEASGITKYKHRRKAAERKLEATEQDMLRLQDILTEVTTRVNSLHRQVKKAERYKKVSDELRAWDLHLARAKYLELFDRRKELSLAIKALDDRRTGIESQIDGRFAEAEGMRATLTDLDRRLSDLSSRLYELSEQAHQLETDISVNQEKRSNLISSASRNREEIDALSKRREVLLEEKSRNEADILKLDNDIAGVAAELEQAILRQKTADDEYLRFRSIAEDQNTKLRDIEGRLSSGRTDSANIDEQIADYQGEIARQNERKATLTAEKNRRRDEIGNIQNRIDGLRSELASEEQSISRDQRELEESLSKSELLRDQAAELTSGFEATLARKSLLTEMIEHYEGFGGGVVAVFDAASRWPGITGTVADILRPREGFQTAVEGALGETAQYILCQTTATAREAVSYLREKKAGRATFLILERLESILTRPEIPGQPGIIGWADTLVECDECYRAVPAALLGRTVICETEDAAQQALGQLPDGFRAATLGGEIFARNGLITGGASEEISLLGRKNEIEALEKKLSGLSDQIRNIRDQQAKTTLTAGELRQTMAKLNQKVADDRELLADLNSRLKEEQFKINAADEVITSVDQQIEQISRKLEKLTHRQYTLSLDFNQLDQEKASVSAEAENKRLRLETLEKTAHDAGEEVNRRHVSKIELESKRAHQVSQLTYFNEMLSDIAANIEQKERQIKEAEAETESLTQQMQENEIRLKSLFDARELESNGQQTLHQSRDELTTRINEIEDQIRKLRKEKELIGDERHQIDISLTEISSRGEQLEERISSEYKLDIRELEAPPPDPALTPEAASQHMADLRDKLDNMGIVNLLALEEYEEQSQRQEFLSKQLNDLISAKTTLKATIHKINQTARALFMETMEKARANFKEMYQELFTGGEADVLLVDESNPLESPIEIISRPRGKKPLTIAQLSGGERALTAISLLFALYMVKPSPFCFLDEIDAPLDDVNVGRFLKIVRKFSAKTQFIIITHNKITMEAADTLYGVTMEEPGVSKVVAVRFRKDDEGEEVETLLDLHYSEDNALQSSP